MTLQLPAMLESHTGEGRLRTANSRPLLPPDSALYNFNAVHGGVSCEADVGIQDKSSKNRAVGWIGRNWTQSDGGGVRSACDHYRCGSHVSGRTRAWSRPPAAGP